MADGYLKGNPIRQELLEKALAWIADRDGLESGQMYMAVHQHDEDANDLWLYFQSVINWAKMLFPTKRKGITDAQAWGLLYNMYHSKQYNSNALEADIKNLVMDDDVTKKAGIIRLSSLTALGATKSTCPFVRLLNRRSSVPMRSKVISVPCASQTASIPSTPLRIWKVTTSFLGARAGIPPTTTCRCCARSAMRRSRISDSTILCQNHHSMV